MLWPIASVGGQPKMRSAAGLKDSITPAASRVTIPSATLSSTARTRVSLAATASSIALSVAARVPISSVPSAGA